MSLTLSMSINFMHVESLSSRLLLAFGQNILDRECCLHECNMIHRRIAHHTLINNIACRGGKKIRAQGYPRIKSVMGTGRVAKRVPADIINGYLTTR